MPIGMRWFESAPPRKKQVRFYQDPNQQIIGLPIPQEYPAFLTTGGIGERRWPASIDLYPNILLTTVFVAPGPLPVGTQLLTMAPPRKAQVRVDIVRVNLALSLPFATPPGLPLALPVDTNQAKRKYAVVDLNMLWPNSQLPNRPDPAPGTTSVYVGGAHGGGGTGLGKHRRNKGAEKYVDIAELEVIVRALTGEKASYKMVYETDEILSRFSESEHPEVEDVDFIALSEDKEAVAEIMAIWKRFNEKRNEMFNHLRKIDFDWEE
jgi:hypothetical protein